MDYISLLPTSTPASLGNFEKVFEDSAVHVATKQVQDPLSSLLSQTCGMQRHPPASRGPSSKTTITTILGLSLPHLIVVIVVIVAIIVILLLIVIVVIIVIIAIGVILVVIVILVIIYILDHSHNSNNSNPGTSKQSFEALYLRNPAMIRQQIAVAMEQNKVPDASTPTFPLDEPLSKLQKGGYIGDYIGDYYRVINGILGV